jgi:hypothetical protein
MKYHLHKFIAITVLTMFSFQAYSFPIVENQTYECKTISMTIVSVSTKQEKELPVPSNEKPIKIEYRGNKLYSYYEQPGSPEVSINNSIFKEAKIVNDGSKKFDVLQLSKNSTGAVHLTSIFKEINGNLLVLRIISKFAEYPDRYMQTSHKCY